MQLNKIITSVRKFCLHNNYERYCAIYVQGQSPEPRIREYFYYVDHQGMLFLDDVRIRNFTSCFKDGKHNISFQTKSFWLSSSKG